MAIVDAQTNQGIGVGEQTGGDTGQITTVDELIAGHSDVAINRYKTLDAFVAGHKELETKLGTAIQPLPENATEEQVKAHRATVGCPETVEGYEVPKPELPEGMAFDEELVKNASQYAFDNHVPKGVFEGLAKLVMERQITATKEIMAANAKAEEEAGLAKQKEKDQAIETATNQLKGKHGAEYDKVVEMANRFYDLPGNDEVNKAFTDLMAEHGLNSHPVVLEFFHEAYKLVKEDTIPEGGEVAGKTTEPGQLSYAKSPGMQKGT